MIFSQFSDNILRRPKKPSSLKRKRKRKISRHDQLYIERGGKRQRVRLNNTGPAPEEQTPSWLLASKRLWNLQRAERKERERK